MNKYDNVNPLEKLHDGEPFFFVRAQDKFAPALIMAYAAMLARTGDIAMTRDMHNLHRKFIQWQQENTGKVKHPD